MQGYWKDVGVVVMYSGFCSGIFLWSYSGWDCAMYKEFESASFGRISHTTPHTLHTNKYHKS